LIFSCVMLRGSNSVAARIVDKGEDFGLDVDSADEQLDECGHPLPNEKHPRKAKRTRRIVRVLDLAESSRTGT